MRHWHHLKFWATLAAAEIASFAISAIVATGTEVLIEALGISNRSAGTRVDVIGVLANLYLAYHAFRFARARARRWPQPRGFAVIIDPAPRKAE
jgi:hypothetical protein